MARKVYGHEIESVDLIDANIGGPVTKLYCFKNGDQVEVCDGEYISTRFCGQTERRVIKDPHSPRVRAIQILEEDSM